jgi:hypothetical protein
LNPAADPRSFAAALLDPTRPAPQGLRAWNGSDPAARFAVHRNNVVASLVEALADTFPVVRELVGAQFFGAMATRFVRRHPPLTPVLARYGEGFADFVADFEPARSVPYLADTARLEYARVRSFHAADVAVPPVEELARSIDCGDRVAELRIGLHPSVDALDSDHAVVSIWAAHQDGGDLGEVDPDRPQSALVVRDGLVVLVLPVGRGLSALVRALRSGRPIGESAAEAVGADAAFDLGQALSLLFAHGAVTSIALPPQERR